MRWQHFLAPRRVSDNIQKLAKWPDCLRKFSGLLPPATTGGTSSLPPRYTGVTQGQSTCVAEKQPRVLQVRGPRHHLSPGDKVWRGQFTEGDEAGWLPRPLVLGWEEGILRHGALQQGEAPPSDLRLRWVFICLLCLIYCSKSAMKA